METYREKVGKLLKLMPKTERREIKPGSVLFSPCTGDETSNPVIPKGHVGQISLAEQRGKILAWKDTDMWISVSNAREQFGDKLIISGSHTTCPSCSEIIDK